MKRSNFYLGQKNNRWLGQPLLLAAWLALSLIVPGQLIAAAPLAPTGSTPLPTPAKPAFAPSGKTNSQSEAELQKVVVEAVSPNANTLPTRPTDSVYGLGDTVLDTPRAVYQISKDQLQFDPINQVSDLARYSPSIGSASGQGIGGSPYIRGFTGEVYQDGFRVGRFLRPFDPTTAYESLDIVTGPASVIYGPSSKTSGYLNWTTKKPYFDKNHTEINLTFGKWDSGGQGGHNDFSQQVDNSGPINKDLAYRVVYKQSEADSYYIGGKNDYEHTYAALTWLPTKDISVDWNFEFGNYDYALVRGWNRITQDLVDNGTYTSGVATPVFRSGAIFYEPVANSPNGVNGGFRVVMPNTLTGPTSRYTPTGVVLPAGAPLTGVLQGFVLRPENVSQQKLYSYQGAVNPSDPINLGQYTIEQNAKFNIDSETSIVNKSFYEHDDYHQQTYAGASLQGTISDRFENRTEVRLDKSYKWFGVDVQHKSNSGVDLSFLDETVNFNNSNFNLNGYDISGDQATNLNINNLFGLLSNFPPGTVTGIVPTKAYGTIRLNPIYAIDGFQSPLGGVIGAANYESKVTQAGLYSFHEFIFDNQWTWSGGARATATYVEDTNPVLVPIGGTGFGADPKDTTWAIEPVVTTSLSYKPVPWTTLYATYNYTQALNDDSGNSGGGIGYNNNGQVGRGALHSDSVLYETGAKFEIIPQQLFATLAGYYQERQLTPVVIPGADSVYPQVQAHGFEAAFNYQPNKNFSASLNLSWMEAYYHNFNPNAGFSSPFGVVADGLTVLSATGSATNTNYPRGDYDLSLPKERLNAFATYQFDWGLGFRADLWAQSEFDVTNQYATIPAQYNVNLGVFYNQPNWRVQADFLNVTDQRNFEIANQDSGENFLPSEPFAIEGKFTYRF